MEILALIPQSETPGQKTVASASALLRSDVLLKKAKWKGKNGKKGDRNSANMAFLFRNKPETESAKPSKDDVQKLWQTPDLKKVGRARRRH